MHIDCYGQMTKRTICDKKRKITDTDDSDQSEKRKNNDAIESNQTEKIKICGECGNQTSILKMFDTRERPVVAEDVELCPKCGCVDKKQDRFFEFN